jgi:hypothetical protein
VRRRAQRDRPPSRRTLGRAAEEGESPVGEGWRGSLLLYLSTVGHEESRGKQGRPRSKAKYPKRPIVDEYREGKVKSTPVRGVKENLKPVAHKQSEGRARSESLGFSRGALMACLLKNEPAS